MNLQRKGALKDQLYKDLTAMIQKHTDTWYNHRHDETQEDIDVDGVVTALLEKYNIQPKPAKK